MKIVYKVLPNDNGEYEDFEVPDSFPVGLEFTEKRPDGLLYPKWNGLDWVEDKDKLIIDLLEQNKDFAERIERAEESILEMLIGGSEQ